METAEFSVSDRKSLQETLKSLRAEYAERLPGEIEKLTQLWEQLEAQWDNGVLEDFQRRVHQLAGNAGAFGFSALTEVARPLDVVLLELQQRNTPAEPPEREMIAQHLTRINQASTRRDNPDDDLALADEAAPDTENAAPANDLIYLVEDDAQFAKLLTVELEARGYEVTVFPKIKGLPQAIKQTPPAGVIMDVMLTEGRLAGPKVMFQIQKSRSEPLPLIFISARSDMEARLAAVRANGDAYFTKPFEINQLSAKLRELIHRDGPLDYRVLVVDDSGRYGDKYAKTLRQAGLKASLLTQPMRCLAALDKFPADLVLINTQLSGFSGLELAMVIRQQHQYTHLPLVFFAQQFDRTVSHAAMLGVADDYLSENIAPADLVATVVNRIKNAKQHQVRLEEVRNRDPLTDLYNRQYFVTQLRTIKPPPRADMPLMVLYVVLDNYQGIEKIQGLRAADTLVTQVGAYLKTIVKGTDVLAHLNESTFGILSIARTLQDARDTAEEIRASLEDYVTESDGQRVLSTCSIGIGVRSPDTEDLQQVLRDAATACGIAQKAGGNRIQLHESAVEVKADEERIETIRLAIENNNFSLAFQPVTTLHGSPGAYYDVLLRMQAIDHQQNVPAAEFLPIAAQYGMMPYVDRWVISQATRRLEDRFKRSNPLNFFVRIAKPTLLDRNFLSWLSRHLTSYSFPRGMLIFDISQPLVHDCLKETERFVEHVCELGCRFTLRDFDATPATLQLFKVLEINFVKVHHDLMNGLASEPDKPEQLDRIVAAAHEEGISVVAPFVEDVTTLSLLWQHELDYITGYFIQPPGDNLDYDFEHT